jgi:hypothetical protein
LRNSKIENAQSMFITFMVHSVPCLDRTGARMTRALYFFHQRLAIVRCACGHVSGGVLRKIVTSPLQRELKTIRNPIVNSPIGSYSTDRPNFHSDFLRVDIMPEVECATGDEERCQVEYLETPVKSENDKKEYR